MNPYVSTHPATAPYYREARVTFARRQTACGMRHCFARRIVETGGRRKLGCTPTRWAERHPQGVCRIRKAAEPPTAAQQRMIEAEANRIAALNAATPRAGSAIGKRRTSSSCSLAMKIPFSWGSKGDILFRKREYPLWNPKRKALTLRASSSKSCNACRLHCPDRGVAAFGVARRFGLLLLSAAALPIL